MDKLPSNAELMAYKPKYKIGDVVVYKDPEAEDTKIIQSTILESFALLNEEDKTIDWFYITIHSDAEMIDSLDEEDIIYKL